MKTIRTLGFAVLTLSWVACSSEGVGKILCSDCGEPQAPALDAAAPTHALVGAKVSLKGKALGTAGKVFFGDAEAAVDTWSETAIDVMVPVLPAGEVKVTALAGDVKTNAVAFTVDPGEVTIDSGPLLFTNQTSATFVFTANVEGELECALDGAAWAACTSPHSVSGLSDGEHTMEIRVGGGPAVSQTWTVDTVAPQTNIASAPATDSSERAFTFTSNESSSFECRIDGGLWSACVSGAPLPVSEATHHFEVRAIDRAGNIDATPADALWAYMRERFGGVSSRTVNVGDTLVLTGSGFNAATGTVTFNGTPAVIVGWTNTQITVTVPAVSAGRATVVVQTAAGQQTNSLPVTILGNDLWVPSAMASARTDHSAVWTGSEMIVWGGDGSGTGYRYNPVTDSWWPIRKGGAPQSRRYHAAVWTGQEMIIWGGVSTVSQSDYMSDGTAYNPQTDTWRAIAASPLTARSNPVGAWTGSEMIIWGGTHYYSGDVYHTDGARYNPVSNTWTSLPMANTPGPREGAVALWAGDRFFVWGGRTGVSPYTYPVTGATYKPGDAAWTIIPDSGRQTRTWGTAVWADDRVLIWGGYTPNYGSYPQAPLSFDPETGAWQDYNATGAPSGRYSTSTNKLQSAWAAGQMLVWGGSGGATGGRFDLKSNTWPAIAPANAPTASQGFSLVGTSTDFILWGGFTSVPVSKGARLNVATGTWTPTATWGEPTPRAHHSAVWTGSQMVVWGGEQSGPGNAGSFLNSGGRYDPATDTWLATNTAGAPVGRRWHVSQWSGSELLVWGGRAGDYDSIEYGDGARYKPSTDTWSTMSASPLSNRYFAGSVWDAPRNRLLIWGGAYIITTYGVDNPLAGGAAYYPMSDTWMTLATTGAPTARYFPVMVTAEANAVIVWGGYSQRDGAIYYPESNTWASIPALPNGDTMYYWTNGGGEPHYGHFVHSTKQLVVWGEGYGGKWNYVTRTWSLLNNLWSRPTYGRYDGVAVQAGNKIIYWGGYARDWAPINVGEVWGPGDGTTDEWTPMSRTEALGARWGASGVWTGNALIIWGGYHDLGSMSDGAFYYP